MRERAARPMTVDAPLTYTPQFGPFVRYSQHTNDELGGRNDEGMSRMTNERLPERSIPDRSTGHAFIAIAHPG